MENLWRQQTEWMITMKWFIFSNWLCARLSFFCFAHLNRIWNGWPLARNRPVFSFYFLSCCRYRHQTPLLRTHTIHSQIANSPSHFANIYLFAICKCIRLFVFQYILTMGRWFPMCFAQLSNAQTLLWFFHCGHFFFAKSVTIANWKTQKPLFVIHRNILNASNTNVWPIQCVSLSIRV